MKLTTETPVADVIKVRARIVGLAQLVFEHTSRDAIKAFSQFSKSQELAELIEAQRAGIFDYRVCIQEKENGYAWPKADAVLAALGKAEEGDLSEDDMESLKLEPEDLNRLLMQEETKKAAPKKTTKKTAAPKKAAPKKDPPKTEAKPAGKVTRRTKAVAKPEPVDEIEDVGDGAVAILDRIDQLAQDLESAFTTQEDNVGGRVNAVGNKVDQILLGFRGLVGLTESVYIRQGVLSQQLKCYTDQVLLALTQEEAQEAYDDAGDLLLLPDVPAEAIADIQGALGIDHEASLDEEVEEVEEEEEVEEVEEEEEVEEVEEEAGDTEEEEEEVEEETPSNGVDLDAEVTYSKETLEELSDDDLRSLAGSLGVPKAAKIAYRGVLIKKILRAQQD